jgi:hypothetical protein
VNSAFAKICYLYGETYSQQSEEESDFCEVSLIQKLVVSASGAKRKLFFVRLAFNKNLLLFRRSGGDSGFLFNQPNTKVIIPMDLSVGGGWDNYFISSFSFEVQPMA